jgi:hypothetical protein
MPKSIPKGLTRDHVLHALSDLDGGAEHSFGQATEYELIYEGRRYYPKAVVGLALRHHLGRVWQPNEFSGGEAPARPTTCCEGRGSPSSGGGRPWTRTTSSRPGWTGPRTKCG